MSDKLNQQSIKQLMRLFQKSKEQDAFTNEGDLMEGRSYIPRMSAAMKKSLADSFKGASDKRKTKRAERDERAEELDKSNQENRLMIERTLAEPSYHMSEGTKGKSREITDQTMASVMKSLSEPKSSRQPVELPTEDALTRKSKEKAKEDHLTEEIIKISERIRPDRFKHGGAIPKSLASQGRIYGKNASQVPFKYKNQ